MHAEKTTSPETNRAKLTRTCTETAALVLVVAWYVFRVWKDFSHLPVPSDPLQYLAPAVWRSTYGYWPWLDRIVIAVNLRLFTLFFSKQYVGGMAYIGFVNTCIVSVGMFWAYRKSGFLAAFLTGLILSTSYYLLGFATFVYADQTVCLLALLSFATFFSRHDFERTKALLFLAGILSAFTAFAKITGTSVGIFLFLSLAMRREWREIPHYVGGVVFGSFLVLCTFCLVFNQQSLRHTLHIFLNFGSGPWHGGLTYTNIVSYINILLSWQHFPAYISLFICLQGYKDKDVRRLFSMAWAFVAFIYFVYCVTPRSGDAIPNYIYSAYVFAAVGLGIHLSRILGPSKGAEAQTRMHSLLWNICLPAAALAFMLAGIHIGKVYSPVFSFNENYHYLTKPIDIFYWRYKVDFPKSIRIFYTLGPIALLGFLCYAEGSRKRWALAALVLTIAAWCPAFCGGLAYKKAQYERYRTSYLYEIAPVLNEVQADAFAVYVRRWIQYHPWSSRLPYVYRHFFDEKFERPHTYDGMYKNHLAVLKGISMIQSEAGLARLRKKHFTIKDPIRKAGAADRTSVPIEVPQNKRHILTDDPLTVLRMFPGSVKTQTINLTTKTFGHQTLHVYDISGALEGKSANNTVFRPENLLYEDRFEYRTLGVPGAMAVLGKSGDFDIKLTGTAEKKAVQVRCRTINRTTTQPQIALGYDLRALGLLARISPNRTLVMTVSASRPPNAPAANCHLLLQDKVKKWDQTHSVVQPGVSQEHSVARMLRQGSTDVVAGILWAPRSAEEWLTIERVRIYILD